MLNLQNVTLDITQKCNSNCIYCSSLAGVSGNEVLDINIINSVIDSYEMLEYTSIGISGGEPMTRKDILDIIGRCLDIGIPDVSLYTFGLIPLTEVCKKFKGQEDRLAVIFNYQTCDPDAFTRLSGLTPNHLALVENNMRECIECGFKVKVHLVPNEINRPTLWKTMKRLNDLGVNSIEFLDLVLQGRAFDNRSKLTLTRYEEVQYVKDYFKNSGRTFTMEGKEMSCVKGCMAGLTKIHVKVDGNVYPCVAYKNIPNNEKFVVANLYKDDFVTVVNTLPIPSYKDKCPVQDYLTEKEDNTDGH